MPDPDPLLNQISTVAHETCLYNRVRRELTRAWLENRIGRDFSISYKPRKDTITFRGPSGRIKAHAHELALIDAQTGLLTWCWVEGAKTGAEEPTFAQALRAAGVQRGFKAFKKPQIYVPETRDVYQLAVEVSFAAVSLLGREYSTCELTMDDGSIAVFVIEFEGEQPPVPSVSDITSRLNKVLDDAFNPLASLEGLAESEPGWQFAELNSKEFVLRDPDGNQHVLRGLHRYL